MRTDSAFKLRKEQNRKKQRPREDYHRSVIHLETEMDEYANNVGSNHVLLYHIPYAI